MGIGMKTRTPSQGTFNQEPKKKREDPPQKRRNTTQPQQQKSQSQLQSRPQKRSSVTRSGRTIDANRSASRSGNTTRDAQWHSVDNSQRNSRNNSQRINSQYNNSPYEEEEDFTSQNNHKKSPKKAILIFAVIALISVVFGGFYLFSQGNSQKGEGNPTPPKKVLTVPEEEDTEESPEEGTTTDEGFQTGDSNSEGGKYEEGTLTKTTPEHYSSSDFLKDLNGYEIPAVYTVQNITYDVAHVNYQAKRATIDDGMEFYWLEISYNGKKYRAQCSYNMFRNLESEGICKVAVEILTLDSGQQVISYMKVVSEDYTVDDAENDFNF